MARTRVYQETLGRNDRETTGNVIKYQRLDEEFVKKHLGELTSKYGNIILRFHPMSRTFIEENWERFSSAHKSAVFMSQDLSEYFVETRCSGITNPSDWEALYRTVMFSSSFLNNHWDSMTKKERNIVCENQENMRELALKCWLQFTDEQRKTIAGRWEELK